jgi:plastocyanin
MRRHRADRADNLPAGLGARGHTIKLLVALGLAAAAVAGCGRSSADLANGKALFAGKATCGSCHTLAHANTHGTTGPDLDTAFAQARRDGFGANEIEGIVQHQIGYPRTSSIMPAHLVTGNNARDVAAYVAAVAGVPGQDTGELAQVGVPNTANKSTSAQNGTLTIPADPSGALAFAFGKATATAGKVTFSMPNPSPITHNIAIQGNGASGNGAFVGHGGTSTFSVTLKAGTYTFYCQVPGHAAAGMKGTLTVK